MAKCNQCSEIRGIFELKDGICKQCRDIEEKKYTEIKKELDNIPESEFSKILLTTESSHNLNIEKRLEIISAECAFGMNIFKDFFIGVRDIFGGRSKTTQDTLRKARIKVLEELKKEAYAVGANAVVGVDLDYSEFSGGGKSMLFIVASGTAVTIEK